MILFVYINLLYFYDISGFVISTLKANYFNKNKNLYYINAINNDQGDLFMEFWGENNNIRYFIGLNATTGEKIYFGNENLFSIESSSLSTYHETIIINNNEGYNIFSINYQNFDFINIKRDK